MEPCDDGVGGLEKWTVSRVYAEPLSVRSVAGSSADLSEFMAREGLGRRGDRRLTGHPRPAEMAQLSSHHF